MTAQAISRWPTHMLLRERCALPMGLVQRDIIFTTQFLLQYEMMTVYVCVVFVVYDLDEVHERTIGLLELQRRKHVAKL